MPDDNDPATLGDKPHLGAPVPPTGSAADAADSSAPVADSAGETSGSTTSTEVSADPLFGASPPASASGDQGSRERVEAGSRERVESLRRAREAELQHASKHTSGSVNRSPPPISHLSRAPSPPRPSTLVPYLRRLGMILSILLGASGAISLVWSAFLLPLLHASFSARRALVEQQVDRAAGLLSRLKEIRASGVHAGFVSPEEAAAAAAAGGGEKSEFRRREGDEGTGEKGLVKRDQESKAMIREISHSSAPSSPTTRPSSPAATRVEAAPLLPDISSLVASLRALSSARSHTSTTRTSLLSTIESYTSALHRQLWNPRPGAGAGAGAGAGGGWGTGYGLNTLDQSLAREGGAIKGSTFRDGWEGEGLRDRGEEWDTVRKEIRGIKGMLLGRRSMGLGA